MVLPSIDFLNSLGSPEAVQHWNAQFQKNHSTLLIMYCQIQPGYFLLHVVITGMILVFFPSKYSVLLEIADFPGKQSIWINFQKHSYPLWCAYAVSTVIQEDKRIVYFAHRYTAIAVTAQCSGTGVLTQEVTTIRGR